MKRRIILALALLFSTWTTLSAQTAFPTADGRTAAGAIVFMCLDASGHAIPATSAGTCLAAGGGGGGGLTDTQLRASPVPVTGTFFQSTQPVSIASMPSTPVTGTFWQATQPISGNVGVTGSVAVTGTFWQSTQPVSLATNTPDVTDRAARLLGHVTVDNASIAVTGTFWQSTQPVSGTFWQTTQPVSIASMPSTPVTGTFWQATQPISAAALPLPSNAAQETGGNLATLTAKDFATSAKQDTGNASVNSIDSKTPIGPATASAARPVTVAVDQRPIAVSAVRPLTGRIASTGRASR